ncbi:MAG: zinc metalloprotease, partial [Robiginitalea sp.]|nr:zinc metalloprotease [Robiginitalea sp.]
MKKILLTCAVLGLLTVSCESEVDGELSQPQEIQVDMSDFYVYTDDYNAETAKGGNGEHCATMGHLNEQLRANPMLEQQMYTIEKRARQFIASKKPDGTPGGGNGGGGNDGGG